MGVNARGARGEGEMRVGEMWRPDASAWMCLKGLDMYCLFCVKVDARDVVDGGRGWRGVCVWGGGERGEGGEVGVGGGSGRGEERKTVTRCRPGDG